MPYNLTQVATSAVSQVRAPLSRGGQGVTDATKVGGGTSESPLFLSLPASAHSQPQAGNAVLEALPQKVAT
jgi:hypothetical protein